MRAIVRSVLCLAFVCGSVSAATLFTFDGDTVGTVTTFTDTVGSVSATFSAPPTGFSVQPSFFSTLTGNVLVDGGTAGGDNLALTISFNTALSDLALLFATNSGSPVPLVLNAYLGGVGGTLVGTASASGTIPGGGFTFPEGSIDFNGAVFDTVVLSTTALDFAVDNVSATVTPEPGQLGMVLLGLGLLGLYGQRRNRRS